MFKQFNPNPKHARVGDCTIRAIAKATGEDWEAVYMGLCIEGLIQADMPSANQVWGEYLRKKGFTREIIPNTCPNCYTVAQFARDHRKGKYILALNGHVVAVEDGDYFDSWDSGAEVPVYYWKKEENR